MPGNIPQFIGGGDDVTDKSSVHIQGPHGQRAGGGHLPVVKQHQFCGAAADIHQQTVGTVQGSQGAEIVENGLLLAGEDPDLKAANPPNLLQHLLGVDDIAQRGGGKHIDPLGVYAVQNCLEPLQHLHGLLHSPWGELLFFVDISGQPGRLLAVEHLPRLPVRQLVQDQAHAVGTDVNNCVHRKGSPCRYSCSFNVIL